MSEALKEGGNQLKVYSRKINRVVGQVFKETSSRLEEWLKNHPHWRGEVDLLNLNDSYGLIQKAEDGPFISCRFWLEPNGKDDQREVVSRSNIFDEKKGRFQVSPRVRLLEEEMLMIGKLMGEFLSLDKALKIVRISDQYPPSELEYLIMIGDWSEFKK